LVKEPSFSHHCLFVSVNDISYDLGRTLRIASAVNLQMLSRLVYPTLHLVLHLLLILVLVMFLGINLEWGVVLLPMRLLKQGVSLHYEVVIARGVSCTGGSRLLLQMPKSAPLLLLFIRPSSYWISSIRSVLSAKYLKHVVNSLHKMNELLYFLITVTLWLDL
jgi:hypothetical protein